LILVDLNQVMISNMMMQLGSHKNAEVQQGMIRHMVLNTLRANRMKFKNKYGELVICADDKNYWRKNAFAYYKANRKKDRESSELDWHAIFNALNTIRNELRDIFPYKVLHVPTAEADDIIGTVVEQYGSMTPGGEPILILSGDKDYIQLHRYVNVEQYDPVRKRWIKHSDPDRYLFEHIVKGDRGDGIPNVFSSDSCLVRGERQKKVTANRLQAIEQLNTQSTEIQRNWKRNQMLIDLRHVPDGIKQQVLDQFEHCDAGDRSKLFNYFVKNKLNHLMTSINEF